MKIPTLLLTCLLAHAPTVSGQAPEPPTGSLEFELVREIESARDRIVSLAREVPDSLYDWRPAPGIRSFGEVFMHIALGNYMVLAEAGVPLPGGVPILAGLTPQNSGAREADLRGRETITRFLDASMVHLRGAVVDPLAPAMRTPAASDLLGDWSTRRAVLLRLVIHANEHLGQAIAYARTTGVVPPWSR